MKPTSQRGIYAIRNTADGAVYVGSTNETFRIRWNRHRQDLRNNRHGNPHLQNAWNKWGEPTFEFVILEVCSGAIEDREQEWIDHYRATGQVYNVRPVAASNLGIKRAPGVIETIRAHARRYWASPEARARQAAAIRGTRRDPDEVDRNAAKRAKTYAGAVAPDGTIYRDIARLSTFCTEHGLDLKHMQAVLTGKRGSHRGWRSLTEPRQFIVRSSRFAFVSPEGTEYRDIAHLGQFCAAHGLVTSSMSMVHRGKQPHHKGWRKLV